MELKKNWTEYNFPYTFRRQIAKFKYVKATNLHYANKLFFSLIYEPKHWHKMQSSRNRMFILSSVTQHFLPAVNVKWNSILSIGFCIDFVLYRRDVLLAFSSVGFSSSNFYCISYPEISPSLFESVTDKIHSSLSDMKMSMPPQETDWIISFNLLLLLLTLHTFFTFLILLYYVIAERNCIS